MVPKGWQVKAVGELCEFVNGNGFKSAEWSDKGLPIIRIQNLNGSNEFNYFSGKPTAKWIVDPGDILFAWAGTKGVSFGAKRWLGPKGVLNQHIFRVEPKTETDRDWLYLALLRVTQRVENKAHGFKSTLLHVQKSDITEQVLHVPPLSEQKKIAQTLSTWDTAIATTEKLLANSLQQKKALMQKLLTGEHGQSGEFKRYRFSDLVHIDRKSLTGATPGDFQFSYISLSDVDSGKINSDLEKYTFSDAPSRARRVVAEGDILLATVRPNLQGFAKIGEEHDGCIASTGFAVLTPKEQVCGDYIYQYLYSAHITGQINSLVVGTNYPAINSSDVAGLAIYCPEYEEQKRIASILVSCDAGIRTAYECVRRLKQEKMTLMQQLLTGRRRVMA